MRNGDYDNQLEGQLTIEDLLSPSERMVAVSNIFARARKEMSLAEQKTFVYALSQISWTKSPEEQDTVVRLDKRTLMNILGYTSDPTDANQNLKRAIQHLWKHSYVEFADRDKDVYESGTVIYRVTIFKTFVRISFSPGYFSLFTGLGRNYITLWSEDIFGMTSKRSVQFYELLRQMSYDKYQVGTNVYSYGWGIKAFKEMFGIPKEAYMRSKGGFDRSQFEKRVIDPICMDLGKSKMLQLILQPNGKYYEKVKRGNRVDGYRFFWTFSAYPGVATAPDVKDIQERVDKNPEVLKIAKDITKGQKSPKKKKENSFNNFEQRDYSNDKDLEKKLLGIT